MVVEPSQEMLRNRFAILRQSQKHLCMSFNCISKTLHVQPCSFHEVVIVSQRSSLGSSKSPQLHILVASFWVLELLVSLVATLVRVAGSSLMNCSRPRTERFMLCLKPRPRHT